MTKKYGGRIESWSKLDASAYGTKEELTALYGENLGFMITGRLGTDHKNRGFDNGPIRTSLVVKFTTTQIETLNTIYDLGKPPASSTNLGDT